MRTHGPQQALPADVEDRAAEERRQMKRQYLAFYRTIRFQMGEEEFRGHEPLWSGMASIRVARPSLICA